MHTSNSVSEAQSLSADYRTNLTASMGSDSSLINATVGASRLLGASSGERKATSPSPSERAGSPGRKFDIDSPEMKEFIARGRRDGVPVTSVNLRQGTSLRRFPHHD